MDLRAFPRYRAEVVVDFAPAEEKITGVTWDTSLGGMFVRTARMPEKDQKVFLTLRFADGRQLMLQGLVVRTFRASALERKVSPTGFAVTVPSSESYTRFVRSVAPKETDGPA